MRAATLRFRADMLATLARDSFEVGVRIGPDRWLPVKAMSMASAACDRRRQIQGAHATMVMMTRDGSHLFALGHRPASQRRCQAVKIDQIGLSVQLVAVDLVLQLGCH